MKAIVCEMCGSHDVVKQDGLYVCQTCGTKYSVEDAKKLMVEIEGPVDVSGSTVKVDDSESTEKILQLARRAASEGNSGNAAKYYEMVALSRPDDWEAGFYTVYYQASCCKIAEIAGAASRVNNTLPGTITAIKNTVPADQQKAAYTKVAENVLSLRNSFHRAAYNHFRQFETVSGAAEEFNSRINAYNNMVFLLADRIWTTFHDKDLAIRLIQRCDGPELPAAYKREIYRLVSRIDPAKGTAAKAELNRQERKKANGFIIAGIVFLLIGIIVKAACSGNEDIAMIGTAALIVSLIPGIGFLILGIKRRSAAK